MILNGKDKLVGCSPALPDLSQGVETFLQNVIIGIVQKSQIGGFTQEVILYNKYMAVKQPMKEDLAIQMEGERSWKWYEIHAEINLVLATDDVIVFDQLRYRVMGKLNFAEYGYVTYHVIEDYRKIVI